ncbi:glycosyltransferase involved in cell wall biosynthesis [Dysgonomonas sp. PH5-45]|uniref:glycosyltransferase family 4 protein n=1 Tax=unclassified Dysgonomonas TaxID=2630389 RepID=UPI0024732A6F|nr:MULTISPECIES: glycosyltransferase family 4 protein [unclassified Dysgonomonas]MDH6354142.1 glycosyltransferase involved in cell wall biosynthesis [Dysgonomonas sp. PH5-45]MDH6387007.1 glycosyltransferase involved in cell wall biosynthesis [Dysgonomonas sp. PH5-37]
MKIVYCLVDSSRSGGMERIVCSKANYLADNLGHEVTIITTDRKDKPNFFSFSSKINFIDLGINYSELDGLPFHKGFFLQLKKRKQHRLRLAETLNKIKPDISISTYTHEMTMLPGINDGSKKIAEIHFCKQHKELEIQSLDVSWLKKEFALLADKNKRRFANKYDAFVVLSEDDARRWTGIERLFVIPNLLSFYPEDSSDCSTKRVISAGRLAKQKDYPSLIRAWKLIANRIPDWRLDIFGTGSEKESIEALINELELNNSVHIQPPTSDIQTEFIESSIFALSSAYEGFGLVLAEAMACGIPCVAFDCPSGPSEIIQNNEDGFLVGLGDIEELSKKILYLAENDNVRKEFGRKAKVNVRRFLPDKVMTKWINLFDQLADKN